jgi:hypothetical protein
VTRRPKLALAAAATLLAVPLAACDGGSIEPDGNDGEATPTAPPTDDDNTGQGSDDESDTMGDDEDGRQGPDGSGQ